MGNQGKNTNNTALNGLNGRSTILFYLSILFFIIGFNFTDTPTPFGWYQQFIPNLNGASISDIAFVDSLNGFATTLYRSANDSAFILRTTNGGDNWGFNTSFNYPFYRIQFINNDTGFALSFQTLFKTTNKGINWQTINIPLSTAFVDMYVLNTDTIWGVASEGLTGGVFRTTNGGISWVQQPAPPMDHIYMFNRNIGFITNTSVANYKIYKTTDSGLNWNISNNNQSFYDMFFVDSLKGWSVFDSVRITINGGVNWQAQLLPSGLGISSIYATKFSNIGQDTIWMGGGRIIFPNSQARGILFRTTNMGNNWLYQIPDTLIHSGLYQNIKFINKLNGWANWPVGIVHTVTGGDSTLLTVNQISTSIPKQYLLHQNYPNPFNPKTNIKYDVHSQTDVRILVYEISGKEITELVNQKQSAGTYEVSFDGSNYSSGIYFYSLYADGKLIDTKKMLMIK